MSTRSPPWVTYLDSAESAFTAVLKHERQTHERPTEVAKEAMKVLQACGQIRQNTTPKALDNSELDAWRTETLPTLLAFVVYELASHLSLEGLLKGLRENGGAAALSLAIQLTEAKEKDRQKKNTQQADLGKIIDSYERNSASMNARKVLRMGHTRICNESSTGIERP